jgi:hypothetical protein
MIQWALLQTAPISNSDASYQAFDKSRPTIVWYPFMIWLGLFLGTILALCLYLGTSLGLWSFLRIKSRNRGSDGQQTSEDSRSSNISNIKPNRGVNPPVNSTVNRDGIQNGEGNPARRGKPVHKSAEISGFELSFWSPSRDRGRIHTNRLGSRHC